MRRTAFGLALLALLAALGGWLSRRPPAWLDSDPLVNPFGRLGEPLARGEPDSSQAEPPPWSPQNRLEIATATASELERLPGVGPVLAARILVRRDSLGGVAEAADLDAVAGVGPKLLGRILPLIQFPESEPESSRHR